MKLRIRHILIVLNLCLLAGCINSQESDHGITTKDPKFSKTIDRYLDFKVPVISAEELYQNFDEYIILDIREENEYATSHLEGARHLGYHDVDWSVLDGISKNEKILVYCSIGYRSERLGKKLKKKGYKVTNLYGSIFEWANRNYPLYDTTGRKTNAIHGYSKKWSKWISNDKLEKTY